MSTSKLHTRIVDKDEAGIRLDRWFKRHFPALGHGPLQKLLRSGQVRIDGKRAEASSRLEAGQSVRVPPQVVLAPTKEQKKAQSEKEASRVSGQLKKMIIYEDDDVIVLNKPAGLAVQGGTGLRENLDDMLAGLARKGQGKPKLVHRLDRDTSGVLLVARTAFAATKLTASFRDRATQKIYWAVTLGVPKPARGRIEMPVIKEGEIMKIAEAEAEREKTLNGEKTEAKSAITLYQIMESAKGQAAFVALWPITGRTHQLRVHMQFLGTPMLGDPLYGGEKPSALPVDELGKGLHLHARRLIMPHPRRGVIDAVAPLPPAMQKTWTWFSFDKNAEADFSEA
jgi:23S rRNA pseudouridine955/2504/2580 synthase